MASGTSTRLTKVGGRAAKSLFPHLPVERIFKNWIIHKQAALAWMMPDGVDYILNQLPAAIGYWEDRPDPE
jgi:hypothetical protein